MKEKLSYKEAMAEIEQVVASLEENKLDVDELGVKVKRVSELLAFVKRSCTIRRRKWRIF